MSSRFGALLDNLVGQVRKEFTDPSGQNIGGPDSAGGVPPASKGNRQGAPAASPWSLARIATLSGPAQSNPIVGKSSALIMTTPQGKALHRDIEDSLAPGPRIRVEMYNSSSALRSRQEQLAGIRARESPQGQLQGFTHGYVDGEFSNYDDPTEIVKRMRFVVGAAVPNARSPSGIILEEADWMETSTPFRVLQLATTIFHEFLHAWWQRTKADPDQHLVTTEGRVEILSTGHQGDTSFHIDHKNLQLITKGTIDRVFRQRLEGFVREAAANRKLATAVNKERDKFRAKRR